MNEISVESFLVNKKLYGLALLAIIFVNAPGCGPETAGVDSEAVDEQQRMNDELGDAAMTPEEEAEEE